MNTPARTMTRPTGQGPEDSNRRPRMDKPPATTMSPATYIHFLRDGGEP